jgi:hypothetical protein
VFAFRSYAFGLNENLFTVLHVAAIVCLRSLIPDFVLSLIMTPTLIRSAWGLTLLSLVSFRTQLDL